MKHIVRNAHVLDANSQWHGQSVDIVIEDGTIIEIGKNVKAEGTEVTGDDLTVSPGWVDMMVNFREPGYEHKETIDTGLKCAASGGYTVVCVSPKTEPWIANKSQVEYLINRARNSGVMLKPYGSLSSNGEGKEISEMYDMQQAGAVAFTDDKNYVNAGLMSRALLYSNNINGLVISFPFERLLGDGQINEGETSAMTGLKPIASVAEEMQVSRDLSLAEYNNSSIHFSIISSKRSVELIREAKQKGIRVSCGTSVLHLLHNDSALMDFNVDFKVMPPLRSEADRLALWEGIQDGTIDVIVTDHSPEDVDSKKVEFDQAAFGAIGLETAFALLNSNDLFTNDILYKTLIFNPRKILGLTVPKIEVGAQADLTVFSRTTEWTYDESSSLSANSAYLDKKMKGKALATFV